MRILYISLYDECSAGLRSVAGMMDHEGHETHYLHVRDSGYKRIPRSDRELLAGYYRQDPWLCIDIFPTYLELNGPFARLTRTEVDLVLEHVGRTAPDVVAVSVIVGLHPVAAQVSDAIAGRFPSIRIVWGGVYPTLFPRESLEHAHIVCIGEGEIPLSSWARSPGSVSIPGLWFRSANGPIENPPGPAPDLNDLPPALYGCNETILTNDTLTGLSDDHLGNAHVFYASRYCRFDCGYCLSGRKRRKANGRPCERKSVRNLIDEIKAASRQFRLPNPICIWDDNFGEDIEWLREFADLYPREVGIPFGCNTSAAAVPVDSVDLMSRAGMADIAIGLQSGSERIVREVYRRPYALDELVAVARRVTELGVPRLQIDVLTNCPYETEEDCRQTFEALLRLPTPFYLHLAQLVVYPGSGLADFSGPQGGLGEQDFEFWNMMYHLTQFGTFRPHDLRAVADDPHFRRHPDVLAAIADSLLRARASNNDLRRQMHQAEARFGREIARREFLLQNSCHKTIARILCDKIRYRWQRMRGKAGAS